MLLYKKPDMLVFRDADWKCPAEELVAQVRLLSMAGASASGPDPAVTTVQVRQPLAAPYVPPEPGAQEARDADVVQLLQECLHLEGGICTPCRFRQHPEAGVKPWLELERMIPQGLLRTFIERRHEFIVVAGQGETWSYKVREEPAPEEPAPGILESQEPPLGSSASAACGPALPCGAQPAGKQLVIPEPSQQDAVRRAFVVLNMLRVDLDKSVGRAQKMQETRDTF